MTRNTDIPAGYKPSPLGPIPEDWEVKRLGEIGDVLMCRRILKHQTNISSGIPFFKIGTFGGTPDAYISNDLYLDYSQKYPFPNKGAIIISAAGTIGRAVEYDGKPAYFQDSNLVWIDNDESKVLNRYLYYVYGIIRWVSDTGTISRIYNNVIKQKQIIVPPRLEQRKIAEILSTWDKAIELQTVLIAKLILRKKGLMQQLLTSKKRLPGFSEPWKHIIMREVFDPVTEKNDGKGHMPMTISAKMGLVSQEHKFERVVAGNSLVNYTLIKAGDFAYNKGNSNLYEMGCIYRLNDASAVVPFVYICFRSKNETLIDGNFYQYFFANHGLDQQLKKIITSGARGDGLLNVDCKDFFSLQIPYPSTKEQCSIAQILTTVDHEIAKEKQKLEALKQQKKGLMQQLLTGKKRVITK